MIRLNGRLMREKLNATLKSIEKNSEELERIDNDRVNEARRDS